MSLNANPGWKTTRLGLSLTALTLVLLIALVNVRARRSALESEPVVNNIASSTLTQRRIADFESELITITPHGFEPQAITRPEGRVLLMVDNQSDRENVSLALAREGGSRLIEMRVPREQPNWSEAINLAPGSYLLTDPERSYSCRITITAR